jgi:hypothetical protein
MAANNRRSLRCRPSSAGLGLVNEAFGYRSRGAPAGYKVMQDRFCSVIGKARPVAPITRVTSNLGAAARRARHVAHRPAASSGVKALRNTSCARRTSRQAALAFRSLDPLCALREPGRRRRDEERPSSSEQRTRPKNRTTIAGSMTAAHPGNGTVTIANRKSPGPGQRILRAALSLADRRECDVAPARLPITQPAIIMAAIWGLTDVSSYKDEVSS